MIRQRRCWCMIMIKVILLVQSWHVQEMWWLKSPDDNAMKKNINHIMMIPAANLWEAGHSLLMGSWRCARQTLSIFQRSFICHGSLGIWRLLRQLHKLWQVQWWWWLKEANSEMLRKWGELVAASYYTCEARMQRHYSASLNSFTHARVGYDWHCDIPPSMHNMHCLCNAHWMEHWDQSPVRRDSASLGFWMWLNFWGVILPAVPPNLGGLYFSQWLCQQPYHSAKQQGHLDGSHQNY